MRSISTVAEYRIHLGGLEAEEMKARWWFDRRLQWSISLSALESGCKRKSHFSHLGFKALHQPWLIIKALWVPWKKTKNRYINKRKKSPESQKVKHFTLKGKPVSIVNRNIYSLISNMNKMLWGQTHTLYTTRKKYNLVTWFCYSVWEITSLSQGICRKKVNDAWQKSCIA